MSEPRHGEVIAYGSFGLTRVAYVEWGPAESQQVVVCVHGLTRNGRDFDFLARRLAQKGMRVLAPDLPGRGQSEWLKGGSTIRPHTSPRPRR
jgi:alpha-beta hydrolase superfamily lysophospholipase